MIKDRDLLIMPQMRPVFPFQICVWTLDQQVRTTEQGPLKRIVQVVSRRFDSETHRAPAFKCRAVPGDPTTLFEETEIPESQLVLIPWLNKKRIYVHYAHAIPMRPFCFPTDMLRYDDCQLSSPILQVEASCPLPEGEKEMLPVLERPPLGVVGDRIEVAQISTSSRPVWHPVRWRSFSYDIVPLKTMRLEHGEWIPRP